MIGVEMTDHNSGDALRGDPGHGQGSGGAVSGIQQNRAAGVHPQKGQASLATARGGDGAATAHHAQRGAARVGHAAGSLYRTR